MLFVPGDWEAPGVEAGGVFIKDQITSLRDTGLRVDIAYWERRRIKSALVAPIRDNHFQTEVWESEGNIAMIQKGWNPLTSTVLGGRLYASLLAGLVRDYVEKFGRPDVIHAHFALWAGFAASMVKQQLGIPYVLTEHSSSFSARKVLKKELKYYHAAFKGAGAVIAVSDCLRKDIQAYFPDLAPMVVPNVVRTALFEIASYTEKRSNGGYHMVAIGALIARKGHDILLRAFAKVFQADPRVTLTIVGAGPDLEKLRSLAQKLGIDGAVEFLGGVSKEGVKKALEKADLLVHPSLSESFGVVLIEALSMGIPVIATRCGGPESFVTEDVGILINPGSVDELVTAMHRIPERRFDPATLREFTKRNFGEAVIAKALIDVYTRVLQAHVCHA